MGLTGLLKASLNLVRSTEPDDPGHLEAMAEMAAIGEKHFRDLTERQPGFLDYFYEATPVSEIGLLNIGSRPSHRETQDRSKQSVRAIPWIFGWAQSRHTLPAWYGIGTALYEWSRRQPGNPDRLRQMYVEWPFFRSLLSNTQMALFKSDASIAHQYARLCRDPVVRDGVYGSFREELTRTGREVLSVSGSERLIDENPMLRLSLDRRNPYLDPLNAIQVMLLARFRDPGATETDRQQWLAPLLRTVNGIATGMRNTG
jgi:phosphoenolpyruvate carboxylase